MKRMVFVIKTIEKIVLKKKIEKKTIYDTKVL